MSQRGFKRSTFTWIAATTAVVAVLSVAIVIAEFWSGIGDSEISEAGWFAMGLGIIVTLALCVGLMWLIFFSNKRGYDDLPARSLMALRQISLGVKN